MDCRHFELTDLLSEALIALEAGDRPRVETALRRALRWVEDDWLATPSDAAVLPVRPVRAERVDADADDD